MKFDQLETQWQDYLSGLPWGFPTDPNVIHMFLRMPKNVEQIDESFGELLKACDVGPDDSFYRFLEIKNQLMQEAGSLIRDKSVVDPENVRRLIQYLHHDSNGISSRSLDHILGFREQEIEKGMYKGNFGLLFGFEQHQYQPTDYNYTRSFVRHVSPDGSDTIFDLGAGYGKVAVYTALATKAKIKAVELIPQRCEEMRRLCYEYQIDNMEVIESNVLDVDISGGDIYFMFNPFTRRTLAKVLDRLKDVSRDHHIIVAGCGPFWVPLEKQSWLEIDTYKVDGTEIDIYHSLVNHPTR